MKFIITVKCVSCGTRKKVGVEQQDTPMCDVCFMPTVVVEAEIKNKRK